MFSMFPKIFFWYVLCIMTLYYSVQSAFFTSTSFSLHKKGRQVVNGITSSFSEVSLLQCAHLCTKSSLCNAFQHSWSVAGDFKGMCQFVDINNSSGLFEIEDEYWDIYVGVTPTNDAAIESLNAATILSTTESPTTTNTLATTEALRDERNPALICANYSTIKPAIVNCTCSTPDDYCSGILQCSGNVSGKSLIYYLDQTSAVSEDDGYEDAEKRCSDLGMSLITIKTPEEQVTLCSILSKAVGTQPVRSFYIGLKRLEIEETEEDSDESNDVWYFSDGTNLGSFNAWTDINDSFGYCATVTGYYDYRFNWIKDVCKDLSSNIAYYAMCSEIVQ